MRLPQPLHTTPTNARSSGPFEKDASVDAPSAMTGATAEEEDEAEDDGTIVALARSGVTDLARITGRTSLARELGGISLARTAHRATRASLRCRHQEGMMTTTRTRGLGASRSHVLSLASWAVPRPQPLSASSSSLLAR